MKFKIVCNGKIVAAFTFKYERDVCLELLKETFEGCEYTVLDEG